MGIFHKGFLKEIGKCCGPENYGIVGFHVRVDVGQKSPARATFPRSHQKAPPSPLTGPLPGNCGCWEMMKCSHFRRILLYSIIFYYFHFISSCFIVFCSIAFFSILLYPISIYFIPFHYTLY